MDSKVKRIDEHLYNPARTEKQYLVTSAKRLHAKTSLRYRLSKLNQPGGMFNLAGNTFNPHLKTWAILFLVAMLIISGGILSQGPLFHSHDSLILFGQPKYSGDRVILTQNSTTDPFTTIWSGGIANGNLAGYSSMNSGYSGGGGCSPCITQSGNSSYDGTFVAVSKSQLGLDLGSAKQLTFEEEWVFLGKSSLINPIGSASQSWGWFLTTNSTVPSISNANYDPYTDPNVVLLDRTAFGGTNSSFTNTIFIQRTPQRAISLDDYGSCSSGSSCFITTTFNQNLKTNNVFVNDIVLNYTGHSPVSGQSAGTGVNFGASDDCVGKNGISGPACAVGGWGDFIISDPMNTNGTIATTQVFPWLSLATPYYLGFYNHGTGSLIFPIANIGWLVTNSGAFANNFIDYYVPLPTTATPATPDTGGFFGPIVKALISIGVFIISNLFAFASYLWNILQPVFTAIVNLLIVGFAGFATLILGVIKAVLNAIGTGLGISSLGDNVFTFLGDIAAFFTTFFANSLAQLSSFITFLTNGYSTVSASFGTYWTDLVNWTGGIKDLLAGLWVIGGQLFTISFAFMFSGWLLFGAKKFSDSVGEGMEWFNLTRQFVMIGVALALFLFTMILHYVIIPVFHAVTATGEAKKTAEPDIVIGGTGVG